MKRYIKANDSLDNVYAGTPEFGPEVEYVLIDTYGAPQAGADYIPFESWDELQDYIMEDPDVEERISMGYARIEEM